MRFGFPLLAGTLLLPALANGVFALFGALFALGLMSGLLDVAINAQGIEVERRLGCPILGGLHGLWSVGLGLGAGLSALAAALLDPLLHFGIVGTLLALVSYLALGGLLARPGERPLRGGEGHPPG